ncbi:MAG: sigma-70 family RNA polymerase sigma factor [Bacteroidia bacterium]|jgi:RNA polymerase sigma-70 factor (ECF subfamily)|nr:sigma-70 family RNA polymerase sigma factor [Bacteroidia bacterium]
MLTIASLPIFQQPPEQTVPNGYIDQQLKPRMQSIVIDTETIAACRKKERAAQETVYKACYKDFFKICLRYTSSYDDAADVLHDAFIKIFTRIDSYNGTGNFAGWMRRIIVNACLDYHRNRKNAQNVSIEQMAGEVEMEEENQYIIDENKLLELIHTLTGKHLLVFNLFVIEEYTHEEISRELQISVSASKWYVSEARKQLKTKAAQLFHD